MAVGLIVSLAVTAGGMAVQYLLRPKVKQQKVESGKMDDVRVNGSDYGAIIPRTWGVTRLAGNLVWSSGIQHHTVTTNTGGGGGKKSGGGAASTQETKHVYTTSIAILICRNQISAFRRMWAEFDLMVNNQQAETNTYQAESATLSGGASTSTSGTDWNGSGYVTNLGSGGQAVFNISATTPPVQRDGDETNEIAITYVTFRYKSSAVRGVTVDSDVTTAETLSILSSGGAWSAFTHRFVGFADTITYSYASGAAPDLDEIFVEKVYENIDAQRYGARITNIIDDTIVYPPNLDDPGPYYNAQADSVQDGTTYTYTMNSAVPGEQIRFYTGTETQTADDSIVDWNEGRYGTGEGALRTSAMRGQTYVVFQDRTLKSNRVENFTFETDTGDATVNTILEDLFADVGLTSGYYTITATAGLTQTGFLDHQASSRKSLVEFLERYHFFRIGEIDGKIKTILDTFTSSATIDVDLLRAHDYSEELPRFDAEVITKDERELPAEIRVSVMQPDLEYHNESVPARLHANISGLESTEYTFPIVDTADNAREVAERLLLKAHSENQAIEFWGMPEMGKYAIGDVITVPIGDVSKVMRIEKKQITLPAGKIRFQCVSVNPFTFSYYDAEVTELAARTSDQFAPSISFPRNSVVFAIQSQPIREQDKGELGVYLACCGRGFGTGDGISLFREMDADNYVLQVPDVGNSLLGLCEDTLATHGGGTSTEDTTNVLDIWFFDNISLESVLQADLDRHPLINLIRVGDEWIQFRTVAAQTLESNSPYRSKWRISNLWRGRFDTSAAIATHAAGEYAAVVTPSLFFYPLEQADIGQTVSLKAVTGGQAVDVAPISSFTFNGTGAISILTAGEALSAGNLVNVYDDAGTAKMRKADAGTPAQFAHGFVSNAVANGAKGLMYGVGHKLTSSGLTAGTTYYTSETVGAITATAPASSGAIVQVIGVAISTTEILFNPDEPVELA